jgi:pilus assembly protein Flp/PilA
MSKLNNWMIKKHIELKAAKEEGQGLAEYGMILALVAVASAVALGLLSDGIDGVFSDVTAQF